MVSIIIPIYNGEKYINGCIKKLLKQSYIDMEIICVPNNCSDKSVELLKKWSNIDKRVKIFINDEFKGTFNARKRGILEANGNYILFMDIDDCYVNNHAIENMVKAITEDNTSICQFGYIKKICFLKKIGNFTNEKKIFSKDDILNKYIISAALGRGDSFNTSVWTKIYDSKVLKSAISEINITASNAEDALLNFYAFLNNNTKSVSVRNENYYVYNAGIGITSKIDCYSYLKNSLPVFENMYNYAQKINLPNTFFITLLINILYVLKYSVYGFLDENTDKKIILEKIDEMNSFNLVSIAKKELITKYKDELNNYNINEINFMCSNYASKEYYDYCVRTIPKKNIKQKIIKFLSKLQKLFI